ncbi:unnamed protein product, partial [Meganyctiphanes norvegica]
MQGLDLGELLKRRSRLQRQRSIDDEPPAYNAMFPNNMSLRPVDCWEVTSRRQSIVSAAGPPLPISRPTERCIPECQGDIGGISTPKLKKRKSQLKLTELTNISKTTKEKIIMQTEGMRQTVLASFAVFCRKTTAHGFSHVMEPGSPVLRFFWLLVTLACLVGVIKMCIEETIIAFIDRIPTTEVKYVDNSTFGLRMPEVTFCNLSPFSKAKMEEYNISESMASYLLLTFKGYHVISKKLSQSGTKILGYKTDFNKYMAYVDEEHNITSIKQLIYALSPTCVDLISSCYKPGESFTGDEYIPSARCCEDIFQPVITTFGVCYTTNPENAPNRTIRLQKIAGILGGHRIFFKNNISDSMR